MKQFEKIRVNKPKSNVFDLSHEKKLNLEMGDLVPVFVQETLPGDKFRVNMEILLRLQPMIAPLMHRVNTYCHFFFVPNRLIWNDWEDFITGGQDGKQAPVFPTISGTFEDWWIDGATPLSDYMGLPVENMVEDASKQFPLVSQLPFRAYQQIYNDYYRDQTLQNELAIDKSSGNIGIDEVVELVTMKKRCWEKDYFTSALPFAQRGDAVTIPMGTSAPLEYYNNTAAAVSQVTGAALPTAGEAIQAGSAGTQLSTDLVGSDKSISIDVSASHRVDLSTATAADVSELRRAFSIQRWMEKMSRGGYRYIEQMLVQFGVRSKDSRLQRAEYLGGGKLPVKISEVLQQSESGTTPQGTMAGHGFAAGNQAGFNASFTEHGIVLGILSIIPRTNYSQGLPKLFSKFDKFDYYWPDLAHIGEQPVLNQELYVTPNETTNNETFGYQPRYSEYRFANDTVHGVMRTGLDFWHLGRKFGSTPALNSDFVTCDPSDRIWAVESAEHFIAQLYFNVSAIRPVAKFGDPI